MYTAQDIDQ